MNLRTLARRSLAYYAGSNWGVIVGAAIGTMALAGALLVGDSMRASLLRKSLEGLGPFHHALFSNDRFFREALAGEVQETLATRSGEKPARQIRAALLLAGMAANDDGSARANRIQVIGASPRLLELLGRDLPIPQNSALVNAALAAQLRVKPGDEILVRMPKPGALSREVTLTDRNDTTVALRLKIAGELPASHSGNFSLARSQLAPMNVFIPMGALSKAIGLAGKANLLLATGGPGKNDPDGVAAHLDAAMNQRLTLEDAALEIRPVPAPAQFELRTSRVFLDPPVAEAALRASQKAVPLLTYLANLIQHGTNAAPYSFVTAAPAPFTEEGMRDDEIVLSQWLADDLGAKAGDSISLSYFDPGSGARLIEVTNRFVVRGIAPAGPPWDDRTLMPDFPGIEKAESTGDWEVGFELVHTIRPRDEAYWKEKRGTPKAFVTLAAGRRMWGSRFGDFTAVRWMSLPEGASSEAALARTILSAVTPGQLGLSFEPVREQAIRGVQQSQDFGQLFIGFSFFVILSALLLTALLFQFSVERRAAEFGTLLAVGFPAGLVRRLLLAEGAGLAMIGGLLGVIGGVLYARGMLWGLGTLWRDAVGTSALEMHASPSSLAIGWAAGVAAAVCAVWLTVRRLSRVPALDLLGGEHRGVEAGPGRMARWVSAIAFLVATGITAWGLGMSRSPQPGAFFGAGALLLISGVAGASAWLARLGTARSQTRLSLSALAVRGNARARKRAVTTVGLLAAGSFVVAAIGVFRLDASRDALSPSSGTGGFQLAGESTLPVVQDLGTKTGREFFGLSEEDLRGVSVVSMRLRAGDDASCLNLNRAQKPRLLGVRPETLRGRFKLTGAAKGFDASRGWDMLHQWTNTNPGVIGEIPAIGDASSIQWALGKSLGDTVDYQDERGRVVRLRLAGALANSILQGNLLIDEAAFERLFPGESGYRFFLVETPPGRLNEVSGALSRALQDSGLELSFSVARLEQFNAVQNTYLGTFQMLGGLGLLLGSAGLGMVVLRNVLERRGELGLLSAVGFSRAKLRRMLLTEHGALLAVGLAIGVAAAALAVLPALNSSERVLPWRSLAWTLSAVVLNGLLWTWLATRWATRGDPLMALRNE